MNGYNWIVDEFNTLFRVLYCETFTRFVTSTVEAVGITVIVKWNNTFCSFVPAWQDQVKHVHTLLLCYAAAADSYIANTDSMKICWSFDNSQHNNFYSLPNSIPLYPPLITQWIQSKWQKAKVTWSRNSFCILFIATF